MGIQNFPASLQGIIQQNYLQRGFQQSLRARLGYRSIADREMIPNAVGETVTKTRAGLIPVDTTPLDTSANTNFDNGMVPKKYGVEQFTLTMLPYGITLDLNTTTQRVALGRLFVQNAVNLGENARRTLDTLARNALYATYLGGNTRVRATLGAPGTTVEVDDIRGFQTVYNDQGQPVPVSAQYPYAVMIGDDLYQVTAVAADTVNVSTVPGGVSGTLTTSANVSVPNGTTGRPAIGATAPVVLRPFKNGVMRASTAELVAGDTLQMIDNILAAKSIMADNGVPTINGWYHAYLSNTAMQGLFHDEDFKLLYRGAYGSREYKDGDIVELLGVRFIPNNMAPQQTLSGKKIQRTIVCGAGSLIEGAFEGQYQQDTPTDLHLEFIYDGIKMITREPMDRLKQIIAQSWAWIGGYCVPSDITANPLSIPTANNSWFKRAIVIESL